MSMLSQPKVRPLISEWVMANGEVRLALRDPDELIEGTVLISAALAPVLELCDGEHSLAGLHAALSLRHGISLPIATLESLVNQLDAALLLESARAQAARDKARAAYRSLSFREPALAGVSYPADPAELSAMLDEFVASVDVEPDSDERAIRGLVSPHIDYDRGGAVYARTWDHARRDVQAAEVVVIFGTDHAGSPGALTPTRQHYATPWGTLPTDQDVIDRLEAAWGDDSLFAEELHHRREHSIELAAVWLHYMRKGEPVALVPILCGSFLNFTAGEAHPREHPQLAGVSPRSTKPSRGDAYSSSPRPISRTWGRRLVTRSRWLRRRKRILRNLIERCSLPCAKEIRKLFSVICSRARTDRKCAACRPSIWRCSCLALRAGACWTTPSAPPTKWRVR